MFVAALECLYGIEVEYCAFDDTMRRARSGLGAVILCVRRGEQRISSVSEWHSATDGAAALTRTLHSMWLARSGHQTK